MGWSDEWDSSHRLKTPAPPMRIRAMVIGRATRRGWARCVLSVAKEQVTHFQPATSRQISSRSGHANQIMGLTTGERRVGRRRVERKVDDGIGSVEVSCCGSGVRASFIVDSEGVGSLSERDGVCRLRVSVARLDQFANRRAELRARRTGRDPKQSRSCRLGYPLWVPLGR
jgi:hypothetical protein